MRRLLGATVVIMALFFITGMAIAREWTVNDDQHSDLQVVYRVQNVFGNIVALNGGETSRLEDHGSFIMSPICSPDGRNILYRDGQNNFLVTSINGSTSARYDLHEFRPSSASYFNPLPFSVSNDNRIFAFSGWVLGRSLEIFTFDVATSSFRQLTDNTSLDGYPQLSPDGSRVVFQGEGARDFAVYVINSDGTNATKLVEPGYTPIWSPDGSMIVYSRFANPNSQFSAARRRRACDC